RRLSNVERTVAAALPAALFAAARAIGSGSGVTDALAQAHRAIAAAGFGSVEYLELRDAASLAPLDRLGDEPARLLAAAWLGDVRLIDNVEVVRLERADTTRGRSMTTPPPVTTV
ncbi:MAG: pantoate--beta-alanine ligase, partial [Mesorhizobium sp.]|nr:pantoate--beta-alanine ligase [Mesorhizobium sp.]